MSHPTKYDAGSLTGENPEGVRNLRRTRFGAGPASPAAPGKRRTLSLCIWAWAEKIGGTDRISGQGTASVGRLGRRSEEGSGSFGALRLLRMTEKTVSQVASPFKNLKMEVIAMSKGKEVALLLVGGCGWLWLGILCLALGALENTVSSILCVVALLLGIGMVYFAMDKLMTPRKRW